MFIDYIKQTNSLGVNELIKNTRSQVPTAVFGVCDAVKYYLASCLSGKVLYVAKDALTAKRARDEVECYTGETAVFLPAKDDVLLYKKAFNRESLYKRIDALYKIKSGARFVTCTFESLCQLIPTDLQSFVLHKSREYPLDLLLKKLVEMGYERVEFVSGKGEFSLRGDILDVYPVNQETAFRCDFFGDELERIRQLDSYQQKSGEEVREFLMLSARDVCVDNCAVDDIKRKLQASLKKFGVLMARNKAKQIVDELTECLESNITSPSLGFIAPLTSYAQNGVFDFMGDEVTVIFDECKLCKEHLDGLYREHTERVLSLQNAGQAFDFSVRHYYDYDQLLNVVLSKPMVALQSLTTVIPLFTPLAHIKLKTGVINRYALRPAELYSDLQNWKKCGYKVVICCGSAERADQMSIDLDKNGIFHVRTDTPNNDQTVYVTSAYLTNGFIMHDERLVLVGAGDIYVGFKQKKIKSRRKDTFSAPNVGDYAVHEKHGIGIVRGTERIYTTEGAKDYVAMEYFGGDMLYVPVDQLDRLTKYLGGEKAPKLSRIGGVEFERVKQRVRESIAEMSINLKALYKARAENKGFAFSPDNELSREFDQAFEFEETEDQIQSIIEIKKDMESTKVMDRLLCGDVGFGKTEVAFRACFKAVMDRKQVAFVAPTTILTEQHYETAIKRFDGFGVRIALLNRFCSPQKTKSVIEGIKNGDVDIVIGTHKLFSKEIKFFDLGLLVLDEEQCFGVEHKEKLRVIKTNVDTLTMSATPIPRTLHMSLSGIRDISLINTPPVNRIPVQAYVVEESDVLLRDAITRELARGGQVFVLYNRVESIYKFSQHLTEILPEAKFVVAHGQMNKVELENNIMSFYSGERNVLISTTIIENGIDLPSANTLIVIDADHLGLFTLYQLKGRVGRSNKMAHAYFTFKPDKVLSDTAYKRLSALMAHTELGSGYKIAMRDLEIRGAGNVLGREQHGHMDKIGYELYSKLLKEQLGEVTKDFETDLDIRMDAFIPNEYISESSQRLDVYKQISEIEDDVQAEVVYRSLEDTYGKVPREVENLIDIALLKTLCKKCQIVRAVLSKTESFIELNGFEKIGGGVQNALEEMKGEAVLSIAQNPVISFQLGKTPTETLAKMTYFLDFSLKK